MEGRKEQTHLCCCDFSWSEQCKLKQERFVVHVKDSICQQRCSLAGAEWKCLLTILIKKCPS